MHITHKFLRTTKSGSKCLFFLLFEDYIDAQQGLSDRVKAELERFARSLGDDGILLAPFVGDAEQATTSILQKEWEKEELAELRRTPAMLMIDTDFDDFSPRQHTWVLFHLGYTLNDASIAKLRSLLGKTAASVKDADSSPFLAVRDAMQREAVAEASTVFELKPGIFGFSIDLQRA